MGTVKAFVLGYTGATGKALVKELSNDVFFKSVVLIGRRKIVLPEEYGSKFLQETIDFDKIEEHKDVFKDCTVGFCCIGTTAGKAGSPEQFVLVDRDYVVNCATVARESGCEHFHLVTVRNANKNSVFLYTKTKGQTEELVTALRFPKLTIYRPFFLKCEREERRRREEFFNALFKPVFWLSPNKTRVHVEILAKAMIQKAKRPAIDDKEILSNAMIHDVVKNSTPLVQTE